MIRNGKLFLGMKVLMLNIVSFDFCLPLKFVEVLHVK